MFTCTAQYLWQFTCTLYDNMYTMHTVNTGRGGGRGRGGGERGGGEREGKGERGGGERGGGERGGGERGGRVRGEREEEGVHVHTENNTNIKTLVTLINII